MNWQFRPGAVLLIDAGVLASVKGNDSALQNRRWRDIHHFRNAQDVWAFWGIAIRVVLWLANLAILALKTAS